jgi:SAM-dependent methyltransferase
LPSQVQLPPKEFVIINVASRWSPADYAQNAGFVPALGAAALALLDPRPGELVLDIGCGDGTLTQQISAAGAKAIGLDASPEMVEVARAKGVDAYVADAQALDLEAQRSRFGRFDAAFSNAALHWMLDPNAVARGVFALLRPGGRFVGEMGGEGNVRILRRGIREELIERGYRVPAEDPQWYASPAAFRHVYLDAGFDDIEVNLIERPTPLPTGISGWVKTFRTGWMDMAGVAADDREAVARAIEKRLTPELQREDGSYFADYVRLRFKMVKAD